jgi:hypothetical protein
MTTTKTRPQVLQEGDRVRERGRPGMDVATEKSPNFHQVCSYRHNLRRGQVVSLVTKADRSGRRCTYVNVLWDGLASPSQHALSRVERLTP